MRVDSSGNVLIGTTTHHNFSGATTEVVVGTSGTGVNAGGAVTFGSGSGFLGYIGFQESAGTIGTQTSVPLLFSTGNTERMRIDASGRVTMPSQPMASVNLTTTGTTSSGTYELVYNSVQVNIGSHYNSSIGRFTCPVAGVDRVSAFGMGQHISGDNQFFVTARKNGSEQGAIAYNYGGPSDYKHASGNWLVSCAAGDYLSIFVGGTSGYYGNGYQGATFELVG
jgi:hypothetical protein